MRLYNTENYNIATDYVVLKRNVVHSFYKPDNPPYPDGALIYLPETDKIILCAKTHQGYYVYSIKPDDIYIHSDI